MYIIKGVSAIEWFVISSRFMHSIAEQFQDSLEGKRKLETLKLHNLMISKSVAQYFSGGILRFEARGKKKGD